MFSLVQLRQILRRLAKAPVFTGVTLITLSLGVGATTAIFSVVEGVVLKPLAYPGSDELVGVWLNAPGFGIQKLGLGPSIYFTDREQSTTLQDIGAYWSNSFNVTGTGEPANVRGLTVTDGTLPILGVNPVLGRLFSRQDDAPGSPETIMLSYSYWQQKFGGSASVIGRSIMVSAKPREIIGVLPRDFYFLDEADPALFLPMQWDRNKTRVGDFSYKAIARLKPGTTLAQANADQARLLPVAIHSFPPWEGFSTADFEKARLGPDLHPLKQDTIGNVSTVLWVLMGSIAIVLVVACANVANLLLVRVEGRRQELAIRSALGAGQGHISAAILIESLLLGLAGSILGLALAFGALRILVAMAPTGLPRLHEITIDVPVLLFTVGIALFVSFGIGMIPAIKYTRTDLRSALSESGRGQSQSRERQRARNVLVAVQVALSLVLLICSGLMIRTFGALVKVNPGFAQPSTVETFHVYVPRAQIPDTQLDRVVRLEQEILQNITAVPSVSSVALTSEVPMDGNSYIDPIFVRDRTYKQGEIPPPRYFKFVSPGFFTAMGMPLIAGRDLTWSDTYQKRPIAIVSENLAREYWNDPASALGKQIRATSADDWREIIGVVGNIRDQGLDKPERSAIYWPLIQDRFDGEKEFLLRDVAFVVRSPRAGTASLVKEMQHVVWSIDSEMPLADPTTVGNLYTKSMARISFTLVMLCVAGSMALILGIVGIYGVISYAVSQRTREIGIRMALGAQPGELTTLFVKQGLWLTGIGIACGVVAAFAATRLMSSLLFGVSSGDPWTYTATIGSIVAISWLACYLPSRRAASIDPANTLRAE
ncbi:MAG TPA: ABC transporter permease [Candidatus Acidoferrum sp.]|nr:ABC transporter permease [Candidatus Acidoferrum sp.]